MATSFLVFVRRPVTAAAQGLAALGVSPLRTALSTLGVVVGVASVITTLALGDGFERYVREVIAVRTDVQTITVSSRTTEERDGFAFPVNGYPIFALADAAELQRAVGRTAEVTLAVGGRAWVASDRARPHAVIVNATQANWIAFGRREVARGRYFTDVETAHDASVVVLSHKLAAELSPTADPASMLDRTVRVRGRPMVVIGVMPPYVGERQYEVFVPVRAAATTMQGAGVVTPTISVRARTFEALDDVHQLIIEWLAGRYPHWERRVDVELSLQRLEEVGNALLVAKLVMSAIAAVSLAVGGVGIMNVLLSSVSERTREIGVRKAVGATRGDILLQLLAESVAIASAGSGLGTALGVGGAFGLAAAVRANTTGFPMYAAVTWATLVTAVMTAVVVGLAFGIYPALRAARLSPIDAIRHE